MVVMLEENAQGILVTHAAVKHLAGMNRRCVLLWQEKKRVTACAVGLEQRESFQETFGCVFGLPVQFFQLYFKSGYISSKEIVRSLAASVNNV